MLRAYSFCFSLLFISSILAHPLSQHNTESRSTESRVGIKRHTLWAEVIPLAVRENQHPMENSSVSPEDIIHRQGAGVHPCSGSPLQITAKECSMITKNLTSGEYGFIPDGGFKFCTKPRSVKPPNVNGTCYSKAARDDKKSEYLDENEKLKTDDDLITREIGSF